MASSSSPLVFAVQIGEPELIVPAQPTPYETKNLSDIDDQDHFRCHIGVILFYKKVVGMEGRDPAKVLREAIASALVYYYPLAGRLRKTPNQKLVVECTGEGVIFIEADALVRLEQFGDIIQPPFPCADKLLYNVPSSDGILNSPLLLIQVTRLRCGGFICGVRLNHLMMDGIGLHQFLTAVSEMASGARAPSIHPVWKRELLSAQERPLLSCVQHTSQKLSGGKVTPGTKDDQNNIPPVVHCCFFLGAQEITILRNQLALHLRKCSVFELIAACIWRCRTISQRLDPGDEVHLGILVNARTRCNPHLPVGYYGNALGIPLAVSTAGKLCQEPMDYALSLVKKAKAEVTEEFMRSLLNGWGPYVTEGTYLISDQTRLGLDHIDFGWGKPVYGGLRLGTSHPIPSFMIPLKNKKGEDGLIVSMCLHAQSMEIFARELKKMTIGTSLISSPL